jgi:hypothetical protein
MYPGLTPSALWQMRFWLDFVFSWIEVEVERAMIVFRNHLRQEWKISVKRQAQHLEQSQNLSRVS